MSAWPYLTLPAPVPTPPVFFVRVARNGLMLDAASRNDGRFKVESSKLKEEETKSDSRVLSVDLRLVGWRAQDWR